MKGWGNPGLNLSQTAGLRTRHMGRPSWLLPSGGQLEAPSFLRTHRSSGSLRPGTPLAIYRRRSPYSRPIAIGPHAVCSALQRSSSSGSLTRGS